ncbi:MAG: ThuA domain-containing protein [Halioglobus sp.]
MVFSKTNSFRHRDGIAGGLSALQGIAQENNWSIFATENGAVFNAQQLTQFSAVVFLNATGDVLDEQQQAAFEHWLTSGGGWLGIHAAGDGSHKGWSWYGQHLIGADFTAHILGPQFQVAKVDVEASSHPALEGLPASWDHEEEWYSWERSPRVRGFNILVTIDENSYSPVQKAPGRERDLRMGDHPVVWSHCVGAGKSVYSALGHKAEAFEEPHHLKLLQSSLAWLIDSDRPC